MDYRYISEEQVCFEALGLQNAVNSCAIAGTLHEMMRFLLKDHGTSYANEHPAVVIVLSKLCNLAHYPTGDIDIPRAKYDEAWEYCNARKEEYKKTK